MKLLISLVVIALSHTAVAWGSNRVRSCGQDDKFDAADEHVLAKRVANAWNALPPFLRDEFPLAPDRFLVGLDANLTCRQQVFPSASVQFGGNALKEFEGCWRLKKSSTGFMLPQVLVQEQSKELAFTFIKLTMLAFSEFYGDVYTQMQSHGSSEKVWAQSPLAKFLREFVAARELLLRAYVDDMRAAGRNQEIESLAQTLRTSSVGLKESVPAQDLVLSDLVAHYYCNSDEARRFNHVDWIRTRGAFAVMADLLGEPWYVKR